MPIFYATLLLTGVNLLLRFLSTAFQVFLSSRLGSAGIGLLQLVMSVGMLSMTAGMAGVRTSAMYLCAGELGRKKPENVRWMLRSAGLYSLLCSGAVATILALGAPHIAVHWVGNGAAAPALRLFACFLPVTCLCGCMSGYFTAANRISVLAAVEVAEQLLSMAVTAGLLLTRAGSDPVRACQCVIFGSGVGAALTLTLLCILRFREKAPKGPRIPVTRRLLETAVPLALADDLKSGLSTAENLMVPKRLGVAEPLAAFGMLTGMVFPVMMFPAAILFGLAELLIPELARCAAAGSQRRIQYLVKRSLRAGLLYGCWAGGLLVLLARPLCLRLYGSNEAGQQMAAYALLVPMLYCDAVTDAMCKGLGQQKICVRNNIFTGFLDIVFLYFLLPKFGLHGYFASFFLTHALNFLLSIRLLLRVSGVVLTPTAVLKTLAAAAGSAALCRLLSVPGVRAGAFVAAFFAALTLLGVLDREDLRWLRSLLTQIPARKA